MKYYGYDYKNGHIQLCKGSVFKTDKGIFEVTGVILKGNDRIGISYMPLDYGSTWCPIRDSKDLTEKQCQDNAHKMEYLGDKEEYRK